MKEIHRTDKKTKEVIHNLTIAKHVNKIQEDRILRPKIKQTSILLSILLVLDVISTLILLNVVSSAREMNPLLNLFGNVQLSVILSHVLALGVVYFIFIKLTKDININKKYGILGLRIVTFFYLMIVASNIMQLIYWSVFM